MATKVDPGLMSKMTEEEKKITGQGNPVKGGPTAQAQKHANQPLNSEVIHDITKGEEKVTGNPNPMQGGPTSTAQSNVGVTGILGLHIEIVWNRTSYIWQHQQSAGEPLWSP